MDIDKMPKQNMSNSLKNLHVIVVGAGPGGLTFAKSACAHGAKVEVIERAGDPRSDDAGYTDRSFNLTLNNVGRAALGDERAWRGSTDVIGRAIHNFKNGGEIKHAGYGDGDSAILTSVPRPVLRQNLVEIAEEAGVTLQFRTKVLNVDPDTGKVLVEKQNGKSETLAADLVIVADGLHSLSDKMVEALPEGSLNMRLEPLHYVTVLLDKRVCKGLSLHHIHFWHKAESSSVAIGLPNKDGSIAALLISRFDDVPAGTSPFATQNLTKIRLERDFPQVLSLDPNLAQQVRGRKPGRFYYKSISKYILGKRCVIVGDAGSATPPWAGFGANTAIYSADVLVRLMVGYGGNISRALASYEQHKLILAELVVDYADKHGDFLSRKVAQNPEERSIGPVLGQLVNIAVEKSDIPDNVQLLSY